MTGSDATQSGYQHVETTPPFTRSNETTDDTVEYYHARGYSHRRTGNFASAVKDYSKALELNPQHFRSLFNI